MSSQTDFALNAYASPAGPPENLFLRSAYAKGVLAQSSGVFLFEHYINLGEYSKKKDVTFDRKKPEGQDLKIIGNEVGALAATLKHSHHYARSGVVMNPGMARVTMTWLEPSLDAGYVRHTETEVQFKRGEDSNRLLVELKFQKELSLEGVSIKLRETYDPLVQEPRINAFDQKPVEFPSTLIEVVVNGSVLFNLDFSKKDVQTFFPSNNQRLGLAILMTAKVFGYLSILRVLDAAFFSLLASHAVGNEAASVDDFILAVKQVGELITGINTELVLHLPLMDKPSITRKVVEIAAEVVGARIGSFLDQIKRDASLRLDVADVLLRVKTGLRQPNSSAKSVAELLASWKKEIAKKLNIRNPESATVRQIADKLRELADRFEHKFNSDLAGSAEAYEKIYGALRLAVSVYPSGVEPTADVEEVYTAARNAHDKVARRYSSVAAGRLATALERCLTTQPDLRPIVDDLKKKDPASSVKVASLIYLISTSREAPVDVPGGSELFAVISNAKTCIDADEELVWFLDQFASTINDESLWRSTMFGTGVQGLRADILKTATGLFAPLAAKILQNSSLAEAILRRMNDYVLYTINEIVKIAKADGEKSSLGLEADGEKSSLGLAENRSNSFVSAEIVGLSNSLGQTRSQIRLFRNRATALATNIELGNGGIELSGDYARAKYVGVLVPLLAAVTLADLLEVLYDKGEAEARKQFDKIPTLRPDDDINIEKALQGIEHIRIEAVAKIAATDVEKSQQEATEAYGADGIDSLVGLKQLFELAKNGFSAAESTLSSSQFSDRSLRLLNELRRLFQVEANRILPVPSEKTSFASSVRVMHLAVSIAYLLRAYKAVEQLHAQSSSQPSHAVILQEFRLLLSKLARNTVSCIVASLKNKAEAAVDSAKFARELAEYSAILNSMLAASDKQFYSVLMPADRFLSELTFSGSNAATELIKYKKLQKKLFEEILSEPMAESSSLSIFKEYSLTITQRKEIVEDLGTFLSGVVEGVNGLLNAPPQNYANQIAEKVERVVIFLATNIDTANISDESLKNRALLEQLYVKKPVTFSFVSEDDSARFSALRQLAKICGEFFSFVDALVAVPAEIKTVFEIITKLERGTFLLLKRIFQFEGDGEAPVRVFRVDLDGQLGAIVTRGDNLLKQARHRVQSMMISEARLTDAREQKALLDRVLVKVKEEENAEQALEKLDSEPDFSDTLEESKPIEDLRRLFRDGAAFVSLFGQINDAVKKMNSVGKSDKPAALLELESNRNEAKLLFARIRRIVDNYTWQQSLKVYKLWTDMLAVIDGEILTLTASLSDAQRKILEVDAAALRADLLKEFASQAMKIDKSLKESLDSIEKTVKAAKEKSKEADDLSEKLTSLQKKLKELNGDDMQVDDESKGAVAKLESQLKETEKLIANQRDRIGDVEIESKRLAKSLEEGRKTVRDAKQALSAEEVENLAFKITAEVAKGEAVKEQISKLRRTVDNSDEIIDTMSKTLKKAEDKERELALFVANFAKSEVERKNELVRINSLVDGAKVVVAQIGKDRTDLDTEVVGLRSKTDASLANVKNSIKEIDTVKESISKANAALKARQGDQDRLEEKQKNLTNDVDKIKKKVKETEAAIVKIGTIEQGELEKLNSEATKNRDKARESVDKVAVLVIDAKSLYDAGVADAKQIEGLEKEIERVAAGVKKNENRIRELAGKISYEVTGKPLTQLTSVDATFNRAATVLENALFAISQYIANPGRPAPGGGGQQPPNNGGGGGGQPPVKQEPPDLPRDLQPLANALADGLNENVKDLSAAVVKVKTMTTENEFREASGLLDALAFKKPLTDKQVADFNQMLKEHEELIKQMAAQGKEVVEKRDEVAAQYAAAVGSQVQLKEDLSLRIEAIDAAEKDLGVLYSDDGITGSIVDLQGRVARIQTNSLLKLSEIEKSNAGIKDKTDTLQRLIEDAEEVNRSASLSITSAGEKDAKLTETISDYERQLAELRIRASPDAISAIVEPQFLLSLEDARHQVDSVVQSAREQFAQRIANETLPAIAADANIQLLIEAKRKEFGDYVQVSVAEASRIATEAVNQQVAASLATISDLQAQQSQRIQQAADVAARQLLIAGGEATRQFNETSASSFSQASEYAQREAEAIKQSNFDDVFRILEGEKTVVDAAFVHNLRHVWFAATEINSYVAGFETQDSMPNSLNNSIVVYNSNLIDSKGDEFGDLPSKASDLQQYLTYFVAVTIPNRLASLAAFAFKFIIDSKNTDKLKPGTAERTALDKVFPVIETKATSIGNTFIQVIAQKEAIMERKSGQPAQLLMQFYRDVKGFFDDLVFLFSVTYGVYETNGQLLQPDERGKLFEYFENRQQISDGIVNLEGAAQKTLEILNESYISFETASVVWPFYRHKRDEDVSKIVDGEARAFFSTMFAQLEYIEYLLQTQGLIIPGKIKELEGFFFALKRKVLNEQLRAATSVRTLSDYVQSFVELSKELVVFLEKVSKVYETVEEEKDEDSKQVARNKRARNEGVVSANESPVFGQSGRDTRKSAQRSATNNAKKQATSKPMLISNEEFDEDELRDVFMRALALYREEKNSKASKGKATGSTIDL